MSKFSCFVSSGFSPSPDPQTLPTPDQWNTEQPLWKVSWLQGGKVSNQVLVPTQLHTLCPPTLVLSSLLTCPYKRQCTPVQPLDTCKPFSRNVLSIIIVSPPYSNWSPYPIGMFPLSSCNSLPSPVVMVFSNKVSLYVSLDLFLFDISIRLLLSTLTQILLAHNFVRLSLYLLFMHYCLSWVNIRIISLNTK